MIKVFVNGISAKSGGGRSLLTNFLEIARNRDDEFEYIVSVPSIEGYEALSNERVKLFPMGWKSETLAIPLASTVLLPTQVRQLGCDIVFNLSDIPIQTEVPQVFLFDWAYAIYTESPAWKLMSRRDWVIRSTKLFLFKLLVKHVDLTIAQSPLVRDELKNQYALSPISVIGNSHCIDNTIAAHDLDFQLGEGFNALFLAQYYPHKNFEILLPVARILKNRNSTIRFYVTLNSTEDTGAERFLTSVREAGLDDTIINLGSIPAEHVGALFHQVDALFLPTLLETLGLIYFEAMYCDTPILTSDLPFAHEVCRDAALYFDPFDAQSIVSTFDSVLACPELMAEKVSNGQEVLQNTPSWEDTYTAYTEAFESVLEGLK